MDASDTKDLDVELNRYLRRERRMTPEDCSERMEKFEKTCSDAINKAAKAVEARIKVWILGALAGMLLAFIGTVAYLSLTAGAYQERIDQQTRQLERLEQQTMKSLEKNEQAVEILRNLLYQKHEGRSEP